MQREAFLFVRDKDASAGPVVPVSFTSKFVDDGWYQVTTDDGVRLAVYRMNSTAAGLGLFPIWGPRTKLAELAAAANAAQDPAAPLSVVWANRNTSALAMAVMRYYRDWRCTGQERIYTPEGGTSTPSFTNQVRRIIPEGAQLPHPTTTPPPWLLGPNGNLVATLAEAVFRITAISGPAFTATMAGYSDNDDAEATV